MKKIDLIDDFLKFASDYEEKHMKVIPYVYMLLSAFCFSILDLSIKLIHNMPVFEMIYLRSIIGLILNYFWILYFNIELISRDESLNKSLHLRSLLGFFSLATYYRGVLLIPLTEASVIINTAPIWSAMLYAIFLKEDYQIKEFIITLICLGGMLLIVKPDFIFSFYHDDSRAKNKDNEYIDLNLRSLGILFCVVNSFIKACVAISIRNLAGKTNSMVIVFYFQLFNVILPTVCLFYNGVKFINFFEFVVIFISGIVCWLAQVFLSRAILLEKSSKILILSYFQCVLNFFYDILILKTNLDVLSIMGSICIICCIIVIILKVKKTN